MEGIERNPHHPQLHHRLSLETAVREEEPSWLSNQVEKRRGTLGTRLYPTSFPGSSSYPRTLHEQLHDNVLKTTGKEMADI